MKKALNGEEKPRKFVANCIIEKEPYDGTLFLTNYQLVFNPANPSVFKKYHIRPDYFALPYGFISQYF